MTPADTRLQVMWNRLLAVVEEQGQALIRAAFSPIVRECGDISAGIFDAKGRMLAQAVTGTPGHINTMAEAVKTLRSRFPLAQMRPGDIYMTNDPWIASGHLNDFLLMMPVFYRDEVIGFTSCTSHLVDLGGLGMGPEGSDIYDEGLLLPPCKLVSGGAVNALLLEIVKANSREPIANEGDIYALIACCEAGATRLVQMMDEFGLTDLHALSDYIVETSRRGTVEAITALPKGTWRHMLKVDGYDEQIELHAALTIADDHLLLDFDGTAGCVGKGINVPLNYATAYSVFALRCVIGADIPNNAGSLGPFRVTAPAGCILNAQAPAPVAMRHTLGQMTPDLVYGCLSQALPDQVPAEGASCMYDLPLRHAAEAQDKGDDLFALELVFNGGTGARPALDGLSATAFPSGVWGSQIETTEAVAPVLFHRRELRPDSGGPGRFRGGLGQRIELSASKDQDLMLFLSVERVLNPAKGRAGGHSGAPGRIRIGAEGQDLSGKGEYRIRPSETLIFETPGGGGFGPPSQRYDEDLQRDVQAGLVSEDAAQTLYRGADMSYPNPHIARMAPYALASLDVPDGQRLVSLSQNESLRPPSPKAVAAAAGVLGHSMLYPDPDWMDLRHALADRHGLEAQNILCGSGSLDLINCIARVYASPDRAVLAPAHAYPFFRTAAQMANARFDTAPEANAVVSVDALLDAVQPDTGLVFLANPGNPTGTRIGMSELLRLREGLRADILLIIDEAYGEFADHLNERCFDMVDPGNTAVLRTFSKAYGLAGFRVGWGYFPSAVTTELRKVLNPNGVSAPAQAAATAAVADDAYMRETCAQTVRLRHWAATELTQAGWSIFPSFTNFLLIDMDRPDLAQRVDKHLKQQGIFLRPQTGAGLPHALRMTIGPSPDLQAAVKALIHWKQENPE